MGQWYRRKAVKACVLAAGILSGAVFVTSLGVAVSASGTASPAEIVSMVNEPYEESSGFNTSVESLVITIFEKVKLTDFFETDGAYNPDKVIDIVEYGENGTASGENTSGLAYRLEDLVNWSKEVTESGGSGYYEYDSGTYLTDTLYEENGVVVCQKQDGSYDYYYMDDFIKRFDTGLFTAEFTDEYMTQSEFLRLLQEGTYTSSSGDVKISTRDGSEGYVDCWNFGRSLRESYAPAGESNLLDAVNNSEQLNGKLSDIYNSLNYALNDIYINYMDYQGGWEYLQEGNTNLTYLYVDSRTKTVDTNRKEYEDYEKAGENIEKMTSGDSVRYMVVYPELQDFDTNMNVSASSEWGDIRATEGEENSSDIFAVAVDTSYPIQDGFYDASVNYEEAVPQLAVNLVLFVISGIIFFISFVWITVTAGRKPGSGPDSDQICLNGFDRWKTELAAGAVILFWGIVSWLLVSSGMLTTGLIQTTESVSYYTSQFGGTLGYYPSLFVNAMSMSDVAIMFVYGLFTFTCFFIGYTSLVRRIKAKILWRGSLVCAVLSFGRKVFGARSVTMRTLVVLMAFLCIQWLAILVRNVPVMLLTLVVDGIAVWYVLGGVMAKARIKKGIEEIASGNLGYRIDLNGLRDTDLDMAEKVNDIGSGLNRAVDEAMKNERLKTDLITNVSHDIKTPLTSIINYVDILKRSDIADEKIRGYLDILEAKAQRLKTLTEDVVEASKVSSGNITLECMDMNLGELIQQTEGELAEKFSARNLSFVLTMPEEAAVIHADGRRMWRVLENIFGNAAKYAMPGTRVYADLLLTEELVIFTLKNVSEQQLNISADELTERFIRGDISRSTEGSGLGLSIAKSLTTLQGGEFELYLDGDLFKVEIRFKRVK